LGYTGQAQSEPGKRREQHKVLAGDRQHMDDARANVRIPFVAFHGYTVAEEKGPGHGHPFRGEALFQGSHAVAADPRQSTGDVPIPAFEFRQAAGANTAKVAAEALIEIAIPKVALAGVAWGLGLSKLPDHFDEIAGTDPEHRFGGFGIPFDAQPQPARCGNPHAIGRFDCCAIQSRRIVGFAVSRLERIVKR